MGINCFGYGYILCVDQFIPSAIRPVPHTEDLPVPVPLQQYILDSHTKKKSGFLNTYKTLVYAVPYLNMLSAAQNYSMANRV